MDPASLSRLSSLDVSPPKGLLPPLWSPYSPHLPRVDLPIPGTGGGGEAGLVRLSGLTLLDAMTPAFLTARTQLGRQAWSDQLFQGFVPRRKSREQRPRRQRTTFSSEQTMQLELEFRRHEYVTRTRRVELAELLALTETQIKIWFQNRRAKDKRIEKAHADHHIRRLNMTMWTMPERSPLGPASSLLPLWRPQSDVPPSTLPLSPSTLPLSTSTLPRDTLPLSTSTLPRDTLPLSTSTLPRDTLPLSPSRLTSSGTPHPSLSHDVIAVTANDDDDDDNLAARLGTYAKAKITQL